MIFATSAEGVQSIFVGWRPPQAPRMKLRRNPFTGQDQQVQTTEPDDTDAGGASRDWDLRSGDVPRDAGYEGYLESRIPPEIRRLPHRPMKRVLFEMMALVEVMTGKDDLPEALFPPSGCATSFPLMRVPDRVSTSLRNASEADATKLAGRLAKHEAFADWSPVDLAAFVADLRALVRSAAMNDGLYVLLV